MKPLIVYVLDCLLTGNKFTKFELQDEIQKKFGYFADTSSIHSRICDLKCTHGFIVGKEKVEGHRGLYKYFLQLTEKDIEYGKQSIINGKPATEKEVLTEFLQASENFEKTKERMNDTIKFKFV